MQRLSQSPRPAKDERPGLGFPDVVRAWCRRWSRFADESGNVSIVFALGLPLLVGGAGLGVETSFWYLRDLELQAAADAAAYAGALEKLAGSTNAVVEHVAIDSAISNGFDEARGAAAVFSPPQAGSHQNGQAVEVELTQTLPRYFTSLFFEDEQRIAARAVAEFQIASRACVLALDGSASKAVLFSGSADLELTGCSVMSNSVAADALKVQGSAVLKADCIVSAGGVDLTDGVTLSECAQAITKAVRASDPFALIPAPATSSPCQPASAKPLLPGTYCNGLSISGTVAMSPGVYVVAGGDFKINANTVVSGSEVTIYLRGAARVSINGNATVQLSAPTSGAYSGVLFFGDRDSVSGSNTFNGTASSHLTGALYFKRQHVRYLGNFSGQGGCSQIVAGTVEWSGNTTVNQDCTSLGMRDISATSMARIVE